MGLFSGNKMYSIDELTVLEALVLKAALKDLNVGKAREALEHMRNFQLSKADIKFIIPLMKVHYTNLKMLLLHDLDEKDAREVEQQAEACVSCAAKLKQMI